MSNYAYLVLAAVVSVGCASPVVYKDGNSMTLEHDKGDFRDAMKKAVEHCAKIGKAVKHDSTDCSGKCISTFSCTAK